MHPDCERILISEEEIRAKVVEIGRRISIDYAGKEVLMIGILKGPGFSWLPVEITIPTIRFMPFNLRPSSNHREVRILRPGIRG